MMTPLSAAGAYASAARLVTAAAQTPDKPPGAEQTAGANFTTMLKDAIGDVSALGQKSDAQAHALVNGKSNMVDVATAVAETEVAIDAVVAVRDRVIQAYQTIMQMPI